MVRSNAGVGHSQESVGSGVWLGRYYAHLYTYKVPNGQFL